MGTGKITEILWIVWLVVTILWVVGVRFNLG
jgi:hypothetical protein